jgi:ribonuclease P protein component
MQRRVPQGHRQPSNGLRGFRLDFGGSPNAPATARPASAELSRFPVQAGRARHARFRTPGGPVPTELGPAELSLPAVRVGFTVSRKVDNAVARNRVRRRLREVARMVIPGQARADLDYVLVGRQAALARDFAALRQELFEALKRLKALALATP